MTDAHSAMLDLAIELATKEATGQHLSAREQLVADVTWLDVQIAPNGFLGWLSYTSNAGMLRTLAALDTIGCSRVLALVDKALRITAIDPAAISDADREARLDSVSEENARRLFRLDNDFYDAVEECMERLQSFVRAAEAGSHRASE